MKLFRPPWLPSLAVVAGLATAPARSEDLAEIYLFKAAWYEQIAPGDPVLFPQADDPFDFTAVAYLSPDVLADPDWNFWITGLLLRTPSGRTEAMAIDFSGSFDHYEGAVTAQALNLRYGAGTYRLTLSSALSGTSSYDVPLAADDYPPAPAVTNWEAAQHLDASRDFALQWAPFTGGGERTVWVEIADDVQFDIVFDSGPLSGDATSLVIPAGTLVDGRNYQATVIFTRLTHSLLDAIPATYSGFEAYNQVSIHAGGGGGLPTPSQFTGWRTLPEGGLELTLECTPGRLLTLQGAGQPAGPWTALQTSVPAASPITLTVPRSEPGTGQYFRAFQE